MKSTPASKAFTLIELLILVGIIGILAAILVPTVDRVRDAARRSVDASDIRQIGQASLIYAKQYQGRLPPLGGIGKQGLTADGELSETVGATTPSLHAIAAALARSGGLNDASVWISSSDKHAYVYPAGQTTVLTGTTTKTITPEFKSSGLSYAYIAGLNTSFPSNIPVVFTRGLNVGSGGTWIKTANHGVYGDEGGYIVFLGGHVAFYENVGLTAQTGIFTHYSTGEKTNVMRYALPDHSYGQRFYSYPAGPSGSPAGN